MPVIVVVVAFVVVVVVIIIAQGYSCEDFEAKIKKI